MPRRHLARVLACVPVVAIGAVGPALGAQPVPPPPRTATPVLGLEVVTGAPLQLAALGIGTATVSCPAGKIALGAGVDVAGPADALFGYEVKGLEADGAGASVRVRNANVFLGGTVRASATCVRPPAGVRTVRAQPRGTRIATTAACTPTERVIGGGVGGIDMAMLAASAPQGPAAASGWLVQSTGASPTAIVNIAFLAAHCAPAVSVDGWVAVESPPTALGARGTATLAVACPAGTGLLAAGVVQRSTNWLDLIVSRVAFTPGGASARVHNRNVINGGGDVRATLAAVCARMG